ncbi:ThiF family adenylyltransferase [Brevibacterium samyangense]|uniref:ThiF family adenylyltransferase n=1 Tax=Brevibacterium samyangense TaxID=366888 RepID=A0ABN2TJU9_9MICO
MNAERPSAGFPPLVEPGPELPPELVERYRRQITLPHIGAVGQRRIRSASVLVIGAGGLGSPVVHYLAGCGVGSLTIVDDDAVDLSNLHRQVIHGVDTLGEPKAESAARAVARLDPSIRVQPVNARVSAENVLDLVQGHDVIVDGSDNFATRYLVADASEITGVPVVWGAVLRRSGHVSVFWPGRGAHYRDVFPEPPGPAEAPSCAQAGVLGTLPGVIGTVMATQVLLLVTGTGSPLIGRLLVWDEATSTSRTLLTAPDPTRTRAAEIGPFPGSALCTAGAPGPQETVDPAALREILDAAAAGGPVPVLVDVREPWEFAAGALPGSVNVPLHTVLEHGVGALPAGDEVVLYCQGGVRSAQALAALRPAWTDREGRLRHLAGGYDGWQRG